MSNSNTEVRRMIVNMAIIRYILGCFICVQAATVVAHDVWLEPSAFITPINRQVDIDLKVGTRLHGNVLPNIPEWYREFSYIYASKKRGVEGDMGREPAGYFWVQQPGLISVAYVSEREYVELDSLKFHDYLNGEGLEKIVLLREQLGSSTVVGREYFSRCAKTLISVGSYPLAGIKPQNFACPLEIVSTQNPYSLNSGDGLSVQLLFRGKPLSGALVSGFTKKLPDAIVSARTDVNGLARLILNHSGQWLIKAVEMVPIDEEGADWESFWASMTFELQN
ncbi:MAG: putative GH25 family protein [Gammaproteobacteria bacterium]|jgi:uncharacterized GH25 family protein